MRGPCPVMVARRQGRIAEAAETFGYMAPAYAAMNERQVAIGESTFDGRLELVSAKGLIDCDTLTRLMLERATRPAGGPHRRRTAQGTRLVRPRRIAHHRRSA